MAAGARTMFRPITREKQTATTREVAQSTTLTTFHAVLGATGST
jgi:hypothetical protein